MLDIFDYVDMMIIGLLFDHKSCTSCIIPAMINSIARMIGVKGFDLKGRCFANGCCMQMPVTVLSYGVIAFIRKRSEELKMSIDCQLVTHLF